MFARTKRLTLRPAWPEDAPALVAAIGHGSLLRIPGRIALPYTLADAEALTARPRGAEQPVFTIVAHNAGESHLIGGIGIHTEGDCLQFDYWIAPEARGRGYATEAGYAVIAMARHTLPIRRLAAWHALDNPASGRVLAKLGFRPAGDTGMKTPNDREDEAAYATYVLDFDEDRTVPMSIAA